MSVDEIEIGRKYYCREENTEEGYTGFFHIDDKEIRANLFSFDKVFFMDAHDPLILRTEENKLISLHTNFLSAHESRTAFGKPKMTTYHEEIISNVCVVGEDAWLSNTPVKQVTFTVKNTEALLTHSNKIKTIATAEISDLDVDICSVSVAGMNIHFWYQVSYLLGPLDARKVTPYISIYFDNEETLFSYIKRVNTIVSFFMAALSIWLKPSDISISRVSHTEQLLVKENENHCSDHSIRYIWSEKEVKSSDIRLSEAFAHIRNDTELNAFKNCMMAWIERNDTWESATSLMAGSIALRDEISNTRLLMACRWFEKIPGTKSASIISPEHINEISKHVASKANKLGYSGLEKRMRGAISQVKTETHEQRFKRLTKSVQDIFGDDIIDEQFTTYLKEAIRFRGMSAHGSYEPADDDEFNVFVKSIHAMECLCYLLTIKDLPICSKGSDRLKSNSFVRNYKYS